MQQQREQEGLVIGDNHNNNDAANIVSTKLQSAEEERQQAIKIKSRISNQLRKASHFQLELVTARTQELLWRATSNNSNIKQVVPFTKAEDWRDAADILLYWCQAGRSKSQKRKTMLRQQGRRQQQKQGGGQHVVATPLEAVRQSVPQSLALLERMIQEHQALLLSSSSLDEESNQSEKMANDDRKGLLNTAQKVLLLQPSRPNNNNNNNINKSNNWLEQIAQNWSRVEAKQAQSQKHKHKRHEQQQQLKDTVKDEDIIEIPSPQKMLAKLKALVEASGGALPLTATVYQTIMDVALRQGIRKTGHSPQRSSRDASQKAGYTTLIATPDMIETANYVESLLKDMQQANVPPTRLCYETVLKAWERACDGERAQCCLQELCDRYAQERNANSANRRLLQPTRTEFHTVLSAMARGAKSAQTLDQCHALIAQMKDLHEKDALDTLPGVDTYNTLLTCTIHNPCVDDSTTQAERLFEELGQNNQFLRDRTTYTIMLEMYSKRGLASKAAELLKELYNKFEGTQDRNMEPNTKSFNLVMSAWTKVGNAHAVEELFGLMEKLHASKVLRNVAPDRVTYSIIIENWVKQVGKVPDAAYRAFSILQTMKRIGQTGRPSVAPTTVTYNSVINAYAREGKARITEDLLEEMLDDFLHQGNADVRPDLAIFNSVLLAISRSDQQDAAGKIRAYMKQMNDISKRRVLGGGVYIWPDTRSHNALLQAIARSGSCRAGEECEELIESMIQNPNLEPNEISFANVMKAYRNAGKADLFQWKPEWKLEWKPGASAE